MKDRLLFIDGLRGIAALAVMMFHYEGRVSLPLSVFQQGYLGVTIFFVLSGFVIAMSIGNRQLSFGFLGRFALRRAIRLDIPYWASIGALLIIAVFGAKYGANIPLQSAGQVFAHLPYLHEFLGYTPLSPVYWSLCYEIQFYLFLILLLMGINAAFGRLSHPGGMVIVLAILAFSLLERTTIDVTPSSTGVVFWFNFCLGVIVYWVVSRKIPALWLYAALALVLAAAIWKQDAWCYVAAFTAALIYLVARLERMNWLGHSSFQFMGKISYSLYIFHGIFGWYALTLAKKFFNDWIALGVGISVAIISAWVAYLVLERTSIRWSRMVDLTPAIEVKSLPVVQTP